MFEPFCIRINNKTPSHHQRAAQEGAAAQSDGPEAGLLRVLPEPHPPPELPESELHRLPQDPQEARQAGEERGGRPLAGGLRGVRTLSH